MHQHSSNLALCLESHFCNRPGLGNRKEGHPYLFPVDLPVRVLPSMMPRVIGDSIVQFLMLSPFHYCLGMSAASLAVVGNVTRDGKALWCPCPAPWDLAEDITTNSEQQVETHVLWEMIYVGVTLVVMFAVLLTGISSTSCFTFYRLHRLLSPFCRPPALIAPHRPSPPAIV